MGETLREVKRARLSPEASSGPADAVMTGNTDDGGGEWQTVKSKGSRRGRKDNSSRTNQPDHQTDGPRVYFQDRHAADRTIIPAKDLRDLALYVLAEGVAPTWVAVKYVREIRKVVTVMIPGLDDSMIKRAQVLLRERGNTLQRNGQSERPSNRLSTAHETVVNDVHTRLGANHDQGEAVNGNIGVNDDTIMSNTTSKDTKDLSENDMEWLFAQRIRVKAPGDVKWSKVHSPLQAMLVKEFGEDPEKKNFKQPQEKPFQSVRTPITHFIHTADELREAEYPIHPATFTSQADSALEDARRAGSNQTPLDGWVDSNVRDSSLLIPAASKASKRDDLSQGLTIYGIDCEMVLTSDDKSSLARISVVSWPDSKVVLDKFVKPELEITNYFTQFSGITPQILENVTTTLSDIQSELSTLLTPSTVLLGHSLESDLNALKMTHPFIVDTSMIYPHPRGLPLRSSLKFLANKYLKREIQTAGANGHDSIEDAKAVLDLVKLKCEKGPRWGTNEASGETVFKRISRYHGHDGRGRTTAMIEYGTPERGYGKDATVTIGCQNDEEVLDGIIHASTGTLPPNSDPTKKHGDIPAFGVDFTWGRLRSLEFSRGWVTQPNTNSNSTITTSNPDPNSNPSTSQTQPPNLDTPLLTLLSHLSTLHTTLTQSPTPILLILYSGTSDMSKVTHYQSMQSQYRKEFKVKKWDDLSVQWTDTEEQGLRNAVEEARKGWGWVGVL
jgi:RNA exonuclease 1